MMVIDLFVVNFNTKNKLQKLLEALSRTDNGSWELYVADNGSTDGSVEFLLQNEKRYRINMVHYNQNIGYAAACNDLATMGKNPVYGFLNADVWLSSFDVTRIAETFIYHPKQAIMGPKQRNEAGRVVAAGIFGAPQAPSIRGWQELDPYDVKYRDRLFAVSVSGSAYFIRQEVWKLLAQCPIYQGAVPNATGAFLPTPHYYEETFCSYHARAHGLGVVYDGSVSIGHSWHASSRVGGFADRLMPVSRQIFRDACKVHSIPCD